MILTADWHLTDQPKDEYRWQAFDALAKLMDESGERRIIHLGDLGDRKDKHPANLVNRIKAEFLDLGADGIDILMGNHDEHPAKREPYWKVLDKLDEGRIRVHSKPYFPSNFPGLALLPFTSAPLVDWDEIDWRKYKCIMMHQPVNGASSNGYKLSGYEMPMFPRGIKIYSGDIHEPQIVGRVEYVGAPHHVDFGDDYKCRMLVIDDATFEIKREVILHPPAKQLANIREASDLSIYKLQPGDQLKVRMKIDAADLEQWPAKEAEVIAWANSHGVSVSSIEAVIKEQYEGQAVTYEGEIDPLNILAEFGQSEGLNDALMEIGVECLEAAIKGS